MRLFPRALAPRLFFSALMLTMAMVCAAILVLYANTNYIIDRFLNDSVAQRRQTLTQSFEIRAGQATTSLEREIDGLLRDKRIGDLKRSIDESVDDLGPLERVFVLDNQSSIIAGSTTGAPDLSRDGNLVWTVDKLISRRSIVLNGERLGTLQLEFSLADFNNQLAVFADRQREIRSGWRQRATIWAIAVSLIVALVCGLISWISARRLIEPISAITRQARRLQSGDYGDNLAVEREDELGTLAGAFNAMRDQLRQTTISRDYIDNVLASMNDAIIVTSEEGVITHCNPATISLTGYTETALLGMPIQDLIVEADRASFAKILPGMQARDARLATSENEALPVAWSMSVIRTDDPMLAGRIYWALNISERKRSEERIRYLARMYPLT